MNTARIDPISALRQHAHQQLADVLRADSLRAVCARVIEAHRQRTEERRMLLAVQQLDHPGVLADMQAATANQAPGRSHIR